jgi:hypothetical protein
MTSTKKVLIFGVLLWVIPFAVSILIFPIRNSDRPLFESIMPVVVVLCTVIFSNLYLGNVSSHFLKEGILTGTIWLVFSLAIDLVLFMTDSPMHMSFLDYIKDIGLVYLTIPLVTVGFGFLLDKQS